MNAPSSSWPGDDVRRRRRLRKGMYLLPSLFTTANIAAGFYALSQAIQGSATEPWHFDWSAKAIGFAILFDGLDGRIARMTNTTSDFGKQLDSLADVITFGVAPAMLAWLWGFRMLPAMAQPDLRVRLVQIGVIACFMFLMAGASRLARFNIQLNPQPSNPGRPGRKYFVGMPIPAGAGAIAAAVHFWNGVPLDTWWWAAVWTAFVVALSFLMVSTWRFYSFKDIDLRARHPFYRILLIGLLIGGIWYFSTFVLFFLALTYMLSGVFARLAYVLRRRQAAPAAYEEASEMR
ncbi:MAG TPA: phosphatidylcholine/phosphatidylserine synthase [Terriglobales bacterium]|nr:phosphatidylcholine/phosphatidylserine synthase [Terriglobales bacterium]